MGGLTLLAPGSGQITGDSEADREWTREEWMEVLWASRKSALKSDSLGPELWL